MRKALISKAIAAALLGAVCCNAHAAGEVQKFDVPSGDLLAALESFARQAKIDLVYQDEQVKGLRTGGVHGELSPQDAAEKLLEGTPLKVRKDAESGAILIGPQVEPTLPSGVDKTTNQGGARATTSEVTEMDAIVVTAQKREERLRDVPIPVAVVTADSLIESNQTRLQDFYARVPGLNLTTNGLFSGAQVSIRGLTSGVTTAPTVGTVIDDVQYGALTRNGYGYIVPEIDPSDLARVEVLRGPQGTLYGAASLGGLIKYVTIDPSPDGVDAFAQVGMNVIKDGGDFGHSIRGGVNLPLGETLAVRISGFKRTDPGYIDDSVHGRHDVNKEIASGGRLSLLWKPSEEFSLKSSALLQDIKGKGSTIVMPHLGDLEQDLIPGMGYHKKLEVYSAILNARLGKIDVTSVSAYSRVNSQFVLDLNPGGAPTGFGAIVFPTYNVTGAPEDQFVPVRKFTQEFRITTPLSDNLELLVGSFYAKEKYAAETFIHAANYQTGELVAPYGAVLYFLSDASYEELAGFADLTVRFNNSFDVQIGGRYSDMRQTRSTLQTGLLGSSTAPKRVSKDDAFTYLLTPRWKFGEDHMLYTRFASGYRTGSLNSTVTPLIPPSYGPDSTRNYEIGAKGSLFRGILNYDLSVYHIAWKNIQLSFVEPVSRFGYVDNGGNAKSEGVEFSLDARLNSGTTLSGWIAYSNAVLTADLPETSSAKALKGDRLPSSARGSGNFSVNQSFALSENAEANLGISVTYTGKRIGEFTTSSTTPRQIYPAYTKIDLTAGVEIGGQHQLAFYANNVTDRRAILSTVDGITFDVIRPREFGITLSTRF